MRSFDLTFGGYSAGTTPVLSVRSSLLCCVGVAVIACLPCTSLLIFQASSTLKKGDHFPSQGQDTRHNYWGCSSPIYRENVCFLPHLSPKPLPKNPLWFVYNGFNTAKKTYHNHVFYSRDFDIPSHVPHFAWRLPCWETWAMDGSVWTQLQR